jgi:hypothetical protein
MELEMKTFIASALLLAAGSVAAQNSCNLDLDAGVRVSSDNIEFYAAEQPTYKIVDDKYLVVNGQAQKLTPAQQTLVANYAASIRAALPEVRGMALAGIDLAIDGITLAFDGLLGEKNQVSAQLTTELTNLKSDVNRYFSSGNPISFNRGNEDTPDFFGKQFETRIERIVETSLQNSIGSLMFAMGKEALMSGGSMEGFEARMNKFGAQMAEQMSTKAAGMEARGTKLCSAMQAIDTHEEQLKQALPAVVSFNFIRVKTVEADVAQHTI